MKLRWLAMVGAGLALAGTGLALADPAQARERRKAPAHCVANAYQFSLEGLLTNRKPGPNGCAPPAYAYGTYVGQDPDPYIRLQLQRDPATGYAYGMAQ